MRTLALVPDAQPGEAPAGPLVEVVVPVHNEQHVLEASIWRLHGYLKASFPFSFRVTIADNASTDATWLLAKRLAEQLGGVRAVHVPLKGRARALRQVWGASDAAVVAYMDVDLSTSSSSSTWPRAGIHWFLGGGRMGGRSMGGSDAAREIAAWVAASFPATSAGGATVYDLTAGAR